MSSSIYIFLPPPPPYSFSLSCYSCSSLSSFFSPSSSFFFLEWESLNLPWTVAIELETTFLPSAARWPMGCEQVPSGSWTWGGKRVLDSHLGLCFVNLISKRLPKGLAKITGKKKNIHGLLEKEKGFTVFVLCFYIFLYASR